MPGRRKPFALQSVACARLLAGLALTASFAHAEEWVLTQCNPALLVNGVCPSPAKVTATVNDAQTRITLTVAALPNFTLWNSGMFAFNWVAPPVLTAVSALSTVPNDMLNRVSMSGPSKNQIDGFGDFMYAFNLDTSGLNSTGPTSLTVTLAGVGLTLAGFQANAKGNIFAVHLAPPTGATGFASGDVLVPEPVPSALIGLGLILLGSVRYRCAKGRHS